MDLMRNILNILATTTFMAAYTMITTLIQIFTDFNFVL